MAKKESSQQASEQQEGKVDRIDNALQKFSDMLIARMEQMKESKWKKGWTDGRTAQFGLPQNLVGRPYTGSNAFLCQIHTTMEHYRMPVYLTIKQIRDAGGMIKKGEHSIPIFKWDLRIKDKDGKKLSESDYRNMTKEEQAECTVRPYLKVYNEWNIDQTNLEEVNKEKYDAILKRFKSEPIKDEVGMYKNEAFDNLLKEQSWVCPIEYEKFNESAFYSPKRDQIVVPSKKQFNISNTPEDVFKDGMEFYGTTIHEMAHSTGHESRLGRDGIVKIDQFGSDQYAKEELVAELTSALIGNAMGFDSRIRENNIAYLQNWIGSLKKDPKFLKSVMSDVNKSSKMVLEHIDEQRRKLGEKALLDGSLDGVEEKNKNEQQLEELKEEDAKKEVIAKVWPSVNNKITMPSGDILTVDYNKEKDTLEVAYTTSEGEEKVHCTNYDHSQGINQNLGYVWEELSNMKQFQEKETKTEILSQGKDYFTSLMETITSTPNSEHTVLSVKTLPELRDYYKGNPNVGAWINQASNKEIIEAGADFLPNLRYSHKEGRSLYNIEAAYSNINALYPDVVDNDAKRQIVHRIKQAEEVVTSYHNNIEEKFGKEFLMEKENMNKVLSRNDYQEQGQTIQLDPKDEKKYFSSYNYFQMESETAEFDKLKDAENYEGILALAKEYDQGDSMDLEHVETSMTPGYGDDVLIDDENYAVVYNNSVGGAYDLLKKYSENELREEIERLGGIGSNPSDAVKEIAYNMTADEFAAIQKEPVFEMPNGEILYFQYNKETDKIEVGTATNNDLAVSDTFMFERDKSVEANLANVYEEMSQREQYREQEPEEEESLEEEKDIKTENTASISQGRAAASERSNDESYCYSFARFESSERTKAFDSYRESGDHEALLHLAEIMDVSNLIELNKVRKNAPKTSDDKVLVENSSYAVTFNQQNNTYDLLRKIEKEEVLELIGDINANEEIKASSVDVQKLAYEDAAQQIADSEKSNVLIMPNGEKLDFLYSEERNQVDVGKMTPKGMDVQYIFDYDISRSPQRNISTIQDELSHYDEFRLLSDEEVEQREMTGIRWRLYQSKLEMPSGDVLTPEYDQEKDTLNVAYTTEDGKPEIFSTKYRHEVSAIENENVLWEKFAGMKQYQAKQEEKTSKDGQKAEVPHEDSLSDTNVIAEAKHIAATGVPIDKAEKMAKEKFEDINHENMYKEEERKSAEQEKKEAQQKEQQKKKEESKEASEATAKALTHAALLVGALSAAKQNEGIWMNKSQKGNAEFINTHTPITAYNNIMMNLNSDANKYKTNVYTYYNPAKENHMPVKQNEKGMEFHWTSWGYQNAMDKGEVITSKQFDKLPDEEKSFYTKHATRVMQNIYNVEQTTMNANNHDAYVEILKNKGAQLSQNEKEQKGKYSSIMKQWKELKGKHPDALLLFRIGDFYEMYKQDAKRGSEVLGITLTKMNGSKDFHLAGFPHQALDTYLPKLIRAGERVAICDQLESKKTVSQGFDAKAILSKAYATAKEVSKQSGMQYERVMVLQDAKYDSKEDKIVVSGMKGEVGNEKMAALYKANDIYRAVVAATGTENRLDRSGRNNLLPEDDAKHEQLVRELAAGVMMARQGLPAILSKENEKLIPYWEREIKENPKLLGIVERDVNNAVETIDNLVAKRKVDYEAIRGQLPGKTMENPSKYSISQDLAKLPNIETKEIVVVKDILRKEADVILPAGASLEVNNEVPGMRKDRITIALKKEGIDDVRFYNAGGSLGLNKPNSYFQGKEVTLNNLKQYELVLHHTLDVEKQAAPKKEVIIKNFQAIKDDNGRYAFFIKPENEPSFSVYPAKEHLNTFYNVIKTDKQAIVHNALAQRYYEMATKHPDTKLDLITPKKVDVDMKLIERPSITSSAQDAKQKLIFATINGQRVQAPINKQQWQKMWLAEDMGAYKRALAAVIFEPMLKRGMEGEQSQQAVSESEKVEIKEKPAPENKVQETVTETHRTGLHM